MLLNAVLVAVTFLVLMERKVIAWAQSRLGPMRVGPYGILQAIADPIKLILKEDITPAKADKYVFTLAPIMSLVPALVVFAVVPFGPDPLYYVSDINVGLLFIISVTFDRRLRDHPRRLGFEQQVSAAGEPARVGAAHQLRDRRHDDARQRHPDHRHPQPGRHRRGAARGGLWFAFVQPVALMLIFIGGLAETNRAPFDLPEAETELTGGFHTEYSGMRFSLFFLAEYANMIVISAIVVIMFFGGWLAPFPNVAALSFLGLVPPWIWFIGKIFLFLYVFIWIRATLPRYRYDQLMGLGWKVLIPLAIGNLVVTGILKVAL